MKRIKLAFDLIIGAMIDFYKNNNIRSDKISIIILTLVAVLSLTGCSGYRENIQSASESGKSSYFNYEVVENKNSYYGKIIIMRDKDTNVMYVVIDRTYGISMAPLLNSDGTPKLYK